MKNTIRSSKELLNTNNDLQILEDKKFENMDQQFILSLFLCQRKLSDIQKRCLDLLNRVLMDRGFV